MKNAALTATALLMCSLVHADSSVSVYGTIDLGLWGQSKTAATAPQVNAGNAFSVNTGGTAPSVFGVHGSEDLGGGLCATFNLESHLDPDTGTTGFNALWARAANVGLSGDWGAVKVGQQLVPALIAFAATDPRGVRESLSGTQPWALSSSQNAGPGTAVPNSTLAFFAANSVSYQKTTGPLYVGALYAVGEVAGDSGANRVMSLGASFSGPVILSGSWHVSNWASTGERSDRKASIGAGIALEKNVLKANYLSTKAYASNGVTLGDWHIMSFGGTWQASDLHTVTASWYHGKNRLAGMAGDKANSLVLGDEYSLSKRTTLYAQAAAIKAGDAAGIVVSILGSQPVQGATTFVANVGIRHRF